MNTRHYYPDAIILTAILTNESLNAAMEFLLSGEAQTGCMIHMNENQLTLEQTDILIRALADKRCPAGIVVNMESCHITDAHAAKFAGLFVKGKYPANLHLNFACNNIGNDGLFAMAEVLSRGIGIQRPGVFLDFQFNSAINNEVGLHLKDLISHDMLIDGVGFNLDNIPQLTNEIIYSLYLAMKNNTGITELILSTDLTIDILDIVNLDEFIPSYGYHAARQLKEFCCERNRLLHQYRGNPDVMMLLQRFSKKHQCPLPDMARSAPSLRFFAATRANPDELSTFMKNKDGFQTLADLSNQLDDITNHLELNNKYRLCPWSCNIL